MNGGFTGIDFEAENETTPENNTGVESSTVKITNTEQEARAEADAIKGALEDAAENAETTTEPETQPVDGTNSLGAGVKIAPPAENNAEEDLSQYSDGTSKQPMLDPNLPNTNSMDAKQANQDLRFNPVTGEEMSLKELRGEAVDEVKPEDEEKLKTVEIEEKDPSTANTIFLIIFFIFIIAFVIFLPDLQNLFKEYKNSKNNTTKEIVNGKLVCVLETSTVDLDKEFKRVFMYEDNKLKSSKFTTTIKGDATEDEEKLSDVDKECNKIKDSVEALEGIEVSCTLEASKLVQTEAFDYSKLDFDKTSQAYLDADSTLTEYKLDQDIDDIQVKMRQSGYECNKEN